MAAEAVAVAVAVPAASPSLSTGSLPARCLPTSPCTAPCSTGRNPDPRPATQTRKMVHEKHTSTGVSLEEAVDELQKDFEHAMETVITAVRHKHDVNESQMTKAMMANAQDVGVQQAVTSMRQAMAGTKPPSYPGLQAKAVAEEEGEKPRRRKAGRNKRG